MNTSKQYICEAMLNVIKQLEKRNIHLTECRMMDYHFHEYYFRVNASPEIIDSLVLNGVHVIKNSIVCDCHWSELEFRRMIDFDGPLFT